MLHNQSGHSLPSLASASSQSPTIITLSWQEQVAGVVLLSFFSIVSLCANLGLWVVIVRDRALRTTSNYLLLCLSAADILMAAINMPANAWTIAMGRRLFSDSLCELVNYTNVLCLCATVLSLAAITVNRYIRICRPHLYATMYTRLGLLVNIMSVWGLSAALSLPPMFYTRKEALTHTFLCTGNCEAAFYYCASTGIVVIEGTALLMIILYVNIFAEFEKIKRTLSDTEPKGPPPNPLVWKEVPYKPKMSVWSIIQRPKKDKSKAWWFRRVSQECSTSLSSSKQLAQELAIREEEESDHGHNLPDQLSTEEESPPSTIREFCTSESPSPREGTSPTSPHPTPGAGLSDSPGSGEQLPRTLEPGRTGSSGGEREGGERDTPVTDDTSARHSDDGLGRLSPFTATEMAETKDKECTVRRSLSFLGVDLAVVSGMDRKKSRMSKKNPRDRQRAGRHVQWSREEREVTHSIIFIIVAFIVCYIPIWMVLLLLRRFPNMVPNTVVGSTWLLVYCNSMINPLVYGGRNPHIKAGYKRFWQDIKKSCSLRSAQVQPK